MSVFFTRRGFGSEGGGAQVDNPVFVIVKGSGNSSRCYATINGTKYNGATITEKVHSGDTMSFSVYGTDSSSAGRVIIDGTQVLLNRNPTTQTYTWTVPDGINLITIEMEYVNESTTERYGRIEVTTS